MIWASYCGNLEIIKFLVEQGADLEAKDNNGYTSLIEASSYGYIEIVKFLVEQGADIKAKDIDGSTSLNIVSKRGFIEIVKFLVEKGADLEAEDNYGNKFDRYLTEKQKEWIEKIIYDIQCKKNMIKPCKRYYSGV